MGKASSSKKVDRAARAGGKVRSAQSRSLLFPGIITAVVLLGILLIVVSASDNRAEAKIEPRIGTHWHAAIGIYNCDEFLPPLTDDPSVSIHSLHTHADGLVHIHPNSSAAAGYDADLGVFFDTTDVDVDETKIEVPGFDAMEAGGKCGDDDAEIRLAVWDVTDRNAAGQATAWDEEPTIVDGDPSNYRPQDDQLITLAYVPEGMADADIPQPPSKSALAAPADEQPAGGAPPIELPPGVELDPEGGTGTEGDTGADGGTGTEGDPGTEGGTGTDGTEGSEGTAGDTDPGASDPAS